MSAAAALTIAQALLGLHIAAAAFIIAGMTAIPIGVHYRWPIVYAFWLRFTHVVALGVVVVQRLLGQRCFLSVWEEHFLRIAQHGPYPVPLIHSVGYRVVHVPLPFSLTTAVYTAALLLLLFWWYTWRPVRRARSLQRSC